MRARPIFWQRPTNPSSAPCQQLFKAERLGCRSALGGSRLRNRIWRNVTFRRNLSESVPTVPGVYIISKTTFVHSFPLRSEVFYVGRGLSIRARFLAHLDHRISHNDLLYGRILATPSNDPLTFWFSETSKEEIEGFEIELIRELQPTDNKQMYEKNNG